MRSHEVARINGNEVHIWHVNLLKHNDELSSNEILADERARSEKFRCDTARRNYTKTRAALRIILAGYLKASAKSIELGYTAHGKPVLQQNHEAFEFNVSHSGDLAMIAVSRSPVGIDVEFVDPNLDWHELAVVACRPDEMTTWRDNSDELARHCFYAHWTAKEAYLKALGVGLSIPLQAVTVRKEQTVPSLTIDGLGQKTCRCFLHSLDVSDSYVGMLATALARPRIKSFQFHPDSKRAFAPHQDRIALPGFLLTQLDTHNAKHLSRF